MSEDSKQKVDMAGLPEAFTEMFKCSKCTKYLRPPIWIICDCGHNVCDICKTALGSSTCPGSGSCKKISGTIRNVVVENTRKDLNLPISCKNHWAECDFSGDLESVITHEEDCPYRTVTCVVLNCCQKIRFNLIENHMVKEHRRMSNGQWQIIPEVGNVTNGLAGVLAQARLTKTEIESNNGNIPLGVEKREIEVFLVYMPMRKEPSRYKVTVPINGNMLDLCKGLEPMCDISHNKMVVTDISSSRHRFWKIHKPDDKLTNISHFSTNRTFIYEVDADVNGPDNVVVGVCLGEKKSYLSLYLFGLLLLVGVPSAGTNYEQLYDIVLKNLSRYVTVPDPSEEWWKNTPADNTVDKDDEDDQRGPPKLFTINLVHSTGKFKASLPNDGSELKFPEQSYVRLDWHSRAKELFYNDLADWDFKLQFAEHRMFAMKSWRYGGTRFFATLFTGTESLWHLWVTAACGRNDAKKLRAEIRLSSNLVPDCNDVFYRPVLHFESPILSESTRSLLEYTSCLHTHGKVVGKHIKEDAPTDLQIDTAIPYSINIFEKVFLTLDKAEIDGKEESDRDEEDGK